MGKEIIYKLALSINPPSHPWFPYLDEQSTKFCSESETSFPVFRICCPSKEPVVLNDQQLPHRPWKILS